MHKINNLLAKIKKTQKESENILEKERELIDQLHGAILEEILKGDLFRKMTWRIPLVNYNNYPTIERIHATKDDNWKTIKELLNKANIISWSTTTISLNDYVALGIEGGTVTLFPRPRETNIERGIKIPTEPSEYLIFMHEQLLSFVKKYKLKVDFAEVEKQLERLKNDVKVVENTISFCKELNSSLDR